MVQRKGNLLNTAGGLSIVAATEENNMDGFLKKQTNKKKELLYDPAFPLLGMYLDKTIIQEDTCTPVLTAALCKIAMT